mmetsp:Transcript_5308/g.21910  ORF Transcript_5308/g.21910 Transcript_5308/m.21910 type:complete len:215 (+) Transcript_5308:242-886(+)
MAHEGERVDACRGFEPREPRRRSPSRLSGEPRDSNDGGLLRACSAALVVRAPSSCPYRQWGSLGERRGRDVAGVRDGDGQRPAVFELEVQTEARAARRRIYSDDARRVGHSDDRRERPAHGRRERRQRRFQSSGGREDVARHRQSGPNKPHAARRRSDHEPFPRRAGSQGADARRRVAEHAARLERGAVEEVDAGAAARGHHRVSKPRERADVA